MKLSDKADSLIAKTVGHKQERERISAQIELESYVAQLEEREARLLAVARAAAGLCGVERNQYETCYVPEIEPFIEELDAALAAVEDLL